MNPAHVHLAQDQSALIHALVAWPREADAVAVAKLPVTQHALAARGLHAYRVNAHAGAAASLQASYPVIAQMLGEESFDALAKAFWHTHLPRRGDWACWGAMLPEFIESQDQLSDAPWLADVARTEWDLHELAVVADAEQDPSTFAFLTHTDPAQLGLQLAPHRAVWASAWPVVALLQAHPPYAQGTEPDAELLVQAQAMLSAGLGQEVLVSRQGWRPIVREALGAEAEFLLALDTGASLLQALERSPELDFAQWLQVAIQTRLLIAVTPQSVQPSTASQGDLS